MIDSLIDNDVLYKGARYGLLSPIITAISRNGDLGVLAAAKYIIPKLLVKRPPARGSDAAMNDFGSAIEQLQSVEPSDEEVRTAAQLEHDAQLLGLDLDAGESQLCAILLTRNLRTLATGDKRAILAAHALIESGDISDYLSNRFVCLEQLFLALLASTNLDEVRGCVCGEPGTDRAISICFACASPQASEEAIRAGLVSYIGALRRDAHRALADTA